MTIPPYCGLTGGVVPYAPTPPIYTASDYTNAFLDLLPSGRAWPKWPESNLAQTIAALAGTYRRDVGSDVGDPCSALGSSRRAGEVLLDTLPYWAAIGPLAVSDLLYEWQTTVGLPDPCYDPASTLAQKMAQVVARAVGVNSESVCFYYRFAANLGYDIEITELGPFMADWSRAESAVADQDAIFYWQITVPDSNHWDFSADRNVGGDPLGGDSLGPIICEFEKVKPDHTTIIWNLI